MSNRKRREKMKLTQTRRHPRISPTGSVRKGCTTKMRSSSSAAKIRAARKARCRRLCGRSSAQRAPELAGLRDAQVAGALNATGEPAEDVPIHSLRSQPLPQSAHEGNFSGGSASGPTAGTRGRGAIGGIAGGSMGFGAGVPGAAAGCGLGVVIGSFGGSQRAGPGARRLHGGHSHWHSAGGGGSCWRSATQNRSRPVRAGGFRTPTDLRMVDLTLSRVAFVSFVPFGGGGGGGGGMGVGSNREGLGGDTGSGERVGRCSCSNVGISSSFARAGGGGGVAGGGGVQGGGRPIWAGPSHSPQTQLHSTSCPPVGPHAERRRCRQPSWERASTRRSEPAITNFIALGQLE